MCVRMSNERSFLKSQWFSFSTVPPISTDSRQRGFQNERTFSNTPNVLTTLDDATVRGSDVFGGANDREGDGVDEHLSMLSILVVVKRRGVNSDPLSSNNLANLETKFSTPRLLRSMGKSVHVA